jgi:hypothetical protein
MAALDEDVTLIGAHRMIYAMNVPHYWVERPDRRTYHMEQMIHSVTARPGSRYIIGRDRREINDGGPFDIHYMITRQERGWTRETVVFRSGDPSPYPVEENTYVPPPTTTNDEDDATIRRIVIHSAKRPFEITDMNDNTPSYWDEMYKDNDMYKDAELQDAELQDNYIRDDEDLEEPYDMEDLDDQTPPIA